MLMIMGWVKFLSSENFRLYSTVTLHAYPLLLGNLYGSDLLCNHRQYFNVDTVELIKARPRSSTCQAFEELPHGHEVKLVRAVEHNTLYGHCFGKILGEIECVFKHVLMRHQCVCTCVCMRVLVFTASASC